MRRRLALLAAALVATVTACGGGGGSSGDLPISAGGVGQLSINVTDSPIDGVLSAVVQFSGIALKRFGDAETVFTLDPPLRIDLLALPPSGSVPLLPPALVNAGAYESMRLLVDARGDGLDSFLVLPGGAQRPLFIPPGAESGLRMTRGFSVPPGGRASFTIDFDLRKSVLAPQTPLGPFPLEPALRLVDNSTAGGVEGAVGTSTLSDASCPFPTNPALNTNLVYVFDGFGTLPDDIDRGGVEPVTTARVAPNTLGAWVYRINFLPAGRYTVAFTCQGASESPDRSDNLVFIGTRDVLVAPAQFTLAEFF